MQFYYFVIISPLRRVGPLCKYWIQCFVLILIENVPVVLKRKTLKSFEQCIFTTLQLSPLWEGPDPSLEKNWNHPNPTMLCAKFGWKWSRFLILLHVFVLFHNYLPFEKGVVLHLNKLEFPSLKDVLCKDWLKLALWFWRRNFLKKLSIYFYNFSIISHSGRAWPFIWKNLNSL